MQAIYAQGRIAHNKNRSISTCPHAYMTLAWAWWKAGWNDRDLEIKNARQAASV